MTTPILGLDDMEFGQTLHNITHNEAVRLLEAALAQGAISDSTSAEPGSPADGDVYILPASPTGTDWAAQAQYDVAIYRETEWVFFTPVEGFSIWVNDTDKQMVFDGSAFVEQAALSAGISGMGDDEVPYVASGALTSDSNFSYDGTHLHVPGVQLNGGSGTQGQITWNTDEETADLICNGSTLQLGQETVYHCRNNSGADITDGTPVMATGTLGASGRITIAEMDGTDPDNAKLFLGLATETITNGSDGKVTHFGKVRQIDTSGTPYGETWNDGDLIYIDTSAAGDLTNVEPTDSGSLNMVVAIVIYAHASVGTLAVRVNNLDVHAFAHFNKLEYGTSKVEIPSSGGDVEITVGGTERVTIDSSGATVNNTIYHKDSGVAHGMTSLEETDTFGAIGVISVAEGGLKIRGLTESDIGTNIQGMITNETTTATGNAANIIAAYLKSGTSITALSSNANVATFTNNGTVVETTKGNGDKILQGGLAVGGGTDYLDAYEEGSFSAGISIGGSTSGITYTNADGQYTKIGNLVHVSLTISLSSKNSLTGDILLTGLPFVVGSYLDGTLSESCLSVGYWDNLATSVVYLQAVAIDGTTSANISMATAAATGLSVLGGADITDSFNIRVSGTYMV